jgi:hypothetical protein
MDSENIVVWNVRGLNGRARPWSQQVMARCLYAVILAACLG